jgi:hypothetical protein
MVPSVERSTAPASTSVGINLDTAAGLLEDSAADCRMPSGGSNSKAAGLFALPPGR